MISKILSSLINSVFIEQHIFFPETCFAYTISEPKFTVWSIFKLKCSMDRGWLYSNSMSILSTRSATSVGFFCPLPQILTPQLFCIISISPENLLHQIKAYILPIELSPHRQVFFLLKIFSVLKFFFQSQERNFSFLVLFSFFILRS